MQHVSTQIPSTIYGNEALRKAITKICTEYVDIFSRTLSDIPADIPPLEFDIDLEKWQQPSNSGPPRLQTVAKEEEIRQQVTDMLHAKIIRPSQQPYYSQVHLTPKPEGKWRFRIDFRSFNGLALA